MACVSGQILIGRALEHGFVLPMKKGVATGSILTPIDPNQQGETLLREARSQKRKTLDPPLENNQQELDQEIRNLKTIHQEVEK
jgi:hypothetical protein